jgi:aryl-alcohol dehydrogenase-like predicted oxidoreductase
MDYVNLGRTGLKVSRICLGCMTYGTPAWRPWVLDEAASRPFLKRALDLGINFFDTANMYSLGVSEEVVGRALTQMTRRDSIVIATKVYYPMGPKPNRGGLSRKAILAQIDASLRRLGTDHVDLYQTHAWDQETPIEETLEALNDVVRAGKARYVGASTMSAWQFAKALFLAERHGWARFVSMQNHYNLIYREEEREMLPLCRDQGIGVIPFSPLARGFLAGNRARAADADKARGATERARTDQYLHEYYYAEADHEIVSRVRAIAEARAVKPAQVALAWVLAKSGVTAPIVGASRIEQIEDAVAALAVKLTAEEIARLEEPYRPRAVAG